MIVLGSSVFGPLQLRRCLEGPAACPFRTEQGSANADRSVRRRCLAIDHTGSAADWLGTAVTHTDDMALLRQIVAEEGRPVAWLSSNQIVEQVARKVAHHELCLLVSDMPVSSTRMSGSAKVLAAVIAETPSMLRSRVEDPGPLSSVAEIAELTEGMDQAMQVLVLEEAARDGIPFCEVCERARQQRSSSAGSAA